MRSSLLLLAIALVAPIAASAASLPFSAEHPQYAAILSVALAQETVENTNAETDLDEDMSPEDFGLTSVGFLPSNPLYIFKAARRAISDITTTDAAERVDNSLRFAAERLLEAKALAERGSGEPAIAGSLDGFRREVERARTRAEAAVEELGQTEEGRAVATKIMDSVIKYEKLIGRIEKGTTAGAVSAAAEAKTSAGEAFGAAFSLVAPDEAAGTLSDVMDAQRGGAFKDFKNAEVLKTVEASVPEAAQGAVRTARESALSRLEEHLGGETGSRSALGDYVKSTGGNEVRHLEVIQEMEIRPLSEGARASLTAAKEEVLARAEGRFAEAGEKEKRALVGHLSEGTIGDLRVVKELEKNITVESFGEASEVAAAAKQTFADKVGTAVSDAGDRAELLESVERFHDAKSLSVLDEIASLIPPEQQSIFESLKQKAATEIQKDISRARGGEQTRALYQALSGDHPEDFGALDSLNVGASIVEEIRAATAELIKARAGVIKNEERFGRYEDALRTANTDGIGEPTGELSAFFSEQRVVYGSRDKAEKKIAEAKALAETLEGLVSALPLNQGYGDEGFDERPRTASRLLNSAEQRLAIAEAALARGEFGFAYNEAQEAAFAARDGINIARAYKSGKRAPETKPQIDLGDGGGGGEWQLYSRFEFQKFCLSVGGILSQSLSCTLEDGRIFTVEKEVFPVVVPIEFRTVVERKDAICQAKFEGYVYDGAVQSCRKESATGCKSPFVYQTKDACELGVRAEEKPKEERARWVEHMWKFADGVETSMVLDRTDSEYTRYIRNIEASCRLMPKQQFVWKSGAGNDNADNWKNFGIPDCSGQAFAPANCGNNICEASENIKNCSKDCTAGVKVSDAYSCPGFAHERIDSRGARYCQLNTRESCSYFYPQFLYESSYAPSGCPSATSGNTGTATTTQFGNCSINTSRTGCEADTTCDWYVPPSGSPYCSLAVRGSWVSHSWKFSDGSTETSSILARTDREYSEFIASVDAQCKTIARTKFAWKVGAGNDSADNWQNFGIPDCSGTASGGGNTGGGYAGDSNSCPWFSYSKWDKTGVRYCQLNSERKCDYNYPSYLTNGPNYKAEGCPVEDTTGGTPQCSDGRDNDGDGQTDYPSDTGCYSSADTDEAYYPTGGGGSGSTSCDSALTSLLGTGCHQMYTDTSGNTVFCDGPMTKSAKQGDTVTTSGCTSPGGGSGGGTGTTGGGGGTSTIQRCFYPNASINGTSPGYTVWCERDYYNCRVGEPSGAAVPLAGLSLGAPSSCESGWTGGSGGTYGSECRSQTSQSACSGTSGCYWYNAGSNSAYCDSGGSSTSGAPAVPTGVTATAPSTGNSVEIRWIDNSNNETYFKIWRQAGGSWSMLTQINTASGNGPTTGTVITHIDTTAPSGSVSYQIQACNTTTCSADSALQTVWVAGSGGSTSSCSTTASQCYSQTACAGSGYYWCANNNLCYTSSASCPSSGGGTTTNPACSDGRDNDGDGQTDYPSDTGCYSSADTDEAYYPTGGGGSGSTSCDSALTSLLGTGCHQMYTDTSGNTVFCDGPMTKSAKQGDTVTTSGCTSPGGGTSSTSCPSGQYWNGSACVTTSTTDCPSGQYWSGSSCVSSSPSSSCGSGYYWNGTTCISSCSSGQYWNGTSCVASSSGASIWQAFKSWIGAE